MGQPDEVSERAVLNAFAVFFLIFVLLWRCLFFDRVLWLRLVPEVLDLPVHRKSLLQQAAATFGKGVFVVCVFLCLCVCPCFFWCAGILKAMSSLP